MSEIDFPSEFGYPLASLAAQDGIWGRHEIPFGVS